MILTRFLSCGFFRVVRMVAPNRFHVEMAAKVTTAKVSADRINTPQLETSSARKVE